MIATFVWPSTHWRAGGVTALYEFANALARRGHVVQFVHGPAWPDRISSIEELDWFAFDPRVQHHIVDRLDDPSIPHSDVAFTDLLPATTTQCLFIQGFRMFPHHLERQAFRSRCPKVCIARWLVDVGRDFGVPEEQLWYVPMGLDHDLFSVRTPLDERPYDVAMWFNPHPSKGGVAGVSALRQAHERVGDLKAVLFAAVPMDDDTTRALEALPWLDVHIGLDQRGLADRIFNQTKVFMQSSVHEGFGFTAVEAMACGAALVTTDNGGSGDYALDGETALVVPVTDVDALATAVCRLVSDDGERQRLAAAGERYVRRFDWDLGAEVLEAHLERYLAEPEAFQQEPGAERDLSGAT